MGSKNEMTRKEFLMLTFTLIGGDRGRRRLQQRQQRLRRWLRRHLRNNGGARHGRHGGTTGGGGTTGTGGTTGNGGPRGTTGAGGGGGTGAAACTDPLPETQSASDHTHTLTIAASTLNATTAQTFDTGVAAGHMHMVTLEPVELTTLKNGGMRD